MRMHHFDKFYSANKLHVFSLMFLWQACVACEFVAKFRNNGFVNVGLDYLYYFRSLCVVCYDNLLAAHNIFSSPVLVSNGLGIYSCCKIPPNRSPSCKWPVPFSREFHMCVHCQESALPFPTGSSTPPPKEKKVPFKNCLVWHMRRCYFGDTDVHVSLVTRASVTYQWLYSQRNSHLLISDAIYYSSWLLL